MKRRKIVLFSRKRKPENRNELIAYKEKRLRLLGYAGITAAILGVAAMIPQAGYAVSFNGRVIGAVKSAGEVTEIIDRVEEQVSDILGYEYELDGTVELKTGTSGVQSTDLQEVFMESVDEIEKAYSLSVDGKAAAAALDEAILREALDQISAKYAVTLGSSVLFDNQVTISFDYAPADIIKTKEEIVQILDPCSENTKHPVTVRTITKDIHEEPVVYETVYIDDPSSYEGTEMVIQEGLCGTASVGEQVIYINGTEQSRTEMYSIIISQPVEKQIAVGTMFRPRYISYGEYIWPADGVITCNFGYRNIGIGSNNHQGLDIGGSFRSNIIAADGGEVVFAENVYSYGNLVKILHDNGDVTWYAHCDEIIVNAGDKVAQGDVIAYMGTTGVSTGVHLHFEVHKDGTAIDPLTVLP